MGQSRDGWGKLTGAMARGVGRPAARPAFWPPSPTRDGQEWSGKPNSLCTNRHEPPHVMHVGASGQSHVLDDRGSGPLSSMAISLRFLFSWAIVGLMACDQPPSDSAPPPPPPIFSQAPADAKRPQRPGPSKAPKLEHKSAPTKAEASSEVPAIDARLVRITDGDTIVVDVDGKQERIRLIGINTPETKHSPRGPQPFADEATDALGQLLGRHPLQLRLDAEERDHYGRLLAYVYANDTFVNEAMVRQGWAHAMRIPPNVRHAKRFERLANAAKRARIGIWTGPAGPQ